MARNRIKQLTYALRTNLEAMAAYGESKRDYKVKTLQQRRIARDQMIIEHRSMEDIKRAMLHIDAAKDKIFSFNTMSSYIRFVKDFAEFVAAKTGTTRVEVADSIKYIQPYVDSMIEKGYSANTINLKLSAVCKATGTYVVDYQHPVRRYAEVIRGVKHAVRDHFNEHRAADSLELNRAVGLRRAELARFSITDIEWNDKSVLIKSIGKGGKHNETYITDPDKISVIEKYYYDAIADGRTLMLTREQMNHDADLHHARALCAIDEYKRVIEDIKEHPERRDFYKQFVIDFFRKHKKPLKEKLDLPYRLRGAGKAMLEAQGKETVFDRVTVLYVSVTILHHYRSDTTVQHYLIK